MKKRRIRTTNTQKNVHKVTALELVHSRKCKTPYLGVVGSQDQPATQEEGKVEYPGTDKEPRDTGHG